MQRLYKEAKRNESPMFEEYRYTVLKSEMERLGDPYQLSPSSSSLR